MKYIKSKMLYIIIILLTLVMGLSYSIFVVTTNKTDVANLKISNLLYGINIFEEGSNAPINGSSLIMEPNSEKSLYITIYNVNKIETRYALAYQGNVSVSVSSRSNWNPNGNASQ